MLGSTLLRNICYSPLRFVAKGRRCQIALEIARRIEPIVFRTGLLRMPPFSLGNYSEFCASALLQSITHAGIEFDPAIKVIGAKIPPGGSILVSGHFYLDFLFIRWVNDIIGSPAVFLLTGVDEWLIQGTRQRMDILDPTHGSLLQARKVLDEGRPVIAAIDHVVALGKKWTRIPATEREVYASSGLLKFAARTRRPLFFFDTFFGPDGKVTAIVERIDPLDAFTDYARYLSEALDRRQRSLPTAAAAALASRPAPETF